MSELPRTIDELPALNELYLRGLSGEEIRGLIADCQERIEEKGNLLAADFLPLSVEEREELRRECMTYQNALKLVIDFLDGRPHHLYEENGSSTCGDNDFSAKEKPEYS